MPFSFVKPVIHSLLSPGSCFLWSFQLVLFTQVPHFSVILSDFLVRICICCSILHRYGSFCNWARKLRIQFCGTNGTWTPYKLHYNLTACVEQVYILFGIVVIEKPTHLRVSYSWANVTGLSLVDNSDFTELGRQNSLPCLAASKSWYKIPVSVLSQRGK